MQRTLYDVLGVTPDSTGEQIRIAYLSLAREHHPDVSRDPQAHERMAEINEAYETLSDPEKRLQYDISIGLSEPLREEASEATEYDWSWLRCEKCGKRDATLRISIALLTMSFLFFTHRKGAGGGLLCSACRAKDSIWHSLVSMVLGPWGLPWGPVWTVQAIWTNMGGEIQPAEINAQLLRFVAVALHLEGRDWEAADALAASLHFQDDEDARAGYAELRANAERTDQRKVYTSRGLEPAVGRIGFFGAIAAAVVFVALAIGAAVQPDENASGSSVPSFNLPIESPSSSFTLFEPTVSESECRTAVNTLIVSLELEDIITPLVALNMMDETEGACRANPQGTLDALCDTPALNDPSIIWQLVWCS